VILWNLIRHQKPFLVFDWKRNYRDLLRVKGTESVRFYTVAREARPFYFNPWIPPPATPTRTWIKKIIEVLCHAYFAGEGVMDILLRSADLAYRQNSVPLGHEILFNIENIKEKSRQAQWKHSALRIIRATTYGGMGEVTNTRDNRHLVQMLRCQAVLELDALADSDKTFLVEALLLWIHQYRLQHGTRERFLHSIIIEEAHHILLKKKHDVMGEATTDVVMREIRELGEAVVIVDQHPSQISLPAIGNTYATICFNLKHQLDVDTAASCMLLDHQQRQHLGKLEVGEAIVKLQGRYIKPFQVVIPRVQLQKGTVSDDDLASSVIARTQRVRLEGLDYENVSLPQTGCTIQVPSLIPMKSNPLRSLQTRCSASSTEKHALVDERKQIREVLPEDRIERLSARERELLESIRDSPLLTTLQHYGRLALSRHQGNSARKRLLELALIDRCTVTTRRGRVVLYQLSELARHALHLPRGPHVGLEHRYWQECVAKQLKDAGYFVEVESRQGQSQPDILATKDECRLVVEVETGKSDYTSNQKNAQSLKPSAVFMLATSHSALRKLHERLHPDGRTYIMLANRFEPK